jgi:hypothetical protein
LIASLNVLKATVFGDAAKTCNRDSHPALPAILGILVRDRAKMGIDLRARSRSQAQKYFCNTICQEETFRLLAREPTPKADKPARHCCPFHISPAKRDYALEVLGHLQGLDRAMGFDESLGILTSLKVM